jgi:hypothetical protein
MPPVAQSVFDLHRTYDVSVELAARAFAKSRSDGSWIVVAYRVDDGSSEWIVQWSSESAPFATGSPATLGETVELSGVSMAESLERQQMVLVGAATSWASGSVPTA